MEPERETGRGGAGAVPEGRGAPPPGLFRRILGAWGGLRASTRAVLETRPTEAGLLSIAMLSGLFDFLGRTALIAAGPAAAVGPDETSARIGSALVASFFVRTLALYALAGLAGLVARRAGGTGGWGETRAGVFWAALVAAPPMLAAAVLGLAPLPDPIHALAILAASAAFAWAMAEALAEVHGFARGWVVLLVIAGVGLAFWGGVHALVAA